MDMRTHMRCPIGNQTTKGRATGFGKRAIFLGKFSELKLDFTWQYSVAFLTKKITINAPHYFHTTKLQISLN